MLEDITTQREAVRQHIHDSFVKSDDDELEKDDIKQVKIKKVMKEFADGKLKSSDGKKVTDKKQALAIAYSEAESIEKGDDGQLQKARNVGEAHPNGKWVWTEYAPGKYDWRTPPKGQKKEGNEHKITGEDLDAAYASASQGKKSPEEVADLHKKYKKHIDEQVASISNVKRKTVKKSEDLDLEKAEILLFGSEEKTELEKAEDILFEKGGNKHDFSTKERETLSKKKEAMPDGSFPIRNVQDLKDAIKSVGRAKDPEAAKRWIKKRAKELDKETLLSEDWK